MKCLAALNHGPPYFEICPRFTITAQGETPSSDWAYDAVSVDDGQAVVLVGKSSTYLHAVKLDSGGQQLWEWRVSFGG